MIRDNTFSAKMLLDAINKGCRACAFFKEKIALFHSFGSTVRNGVNFFDLLHSGQWELCVDRYSSRTLTVDFVVAEDTVGTCFL